MIVELPRPGGTMRLRSLIARNPSPMTALGTNSYILGEGEVAVIDPGPYTATHLTAIMGALEPGEQISAIFVTHAHRDHSGLAPALRAATGALVHALAAPPPPAPPFDLSPFAGGGEGIDHAFSPDVSLLDGQIVEGIDWSLRVIHTPGHLGDHVCLAAGEVLFTADHVMGWSTSLVSPPEGDMRAYRQSLAGLAAEVWTVFHPGHGPAVWDPAARLGQLMAHRTAREAAILDMLAAEPSGLVDLTRRIYADTPAWLLQAASRNVLAHLVELAQENRIALQPDRTGAPRFHAT